MYICKVNPQSSDADGTAQTAVSYHKEHTQPFYVAIKRVKTPHGDAYILLNKKCISHNRASSYIKLLASRTTCK